MLQCLYHGSLAHRALMEVVTALLYKIGDDFTAQSSDIITLSDDN